LFKQKSFIICSLAFAGLIYNTPVFSSVLRNSHKEVIDHVWQIIYRDFLDSDGEFNKTEWILLRKDLLEKKYNNSLDAYDAIRKMLARLKDPYTRFLDPKEFSQMRIDTSGELTGIGIQIIKDDKNDNLLIVSPIEGSPASKAGIKAKDKIITIDNISTKGMDIEQAVRLIRGKAGTKVNLGISRNGNKFNKLLLRQRIEIKSVKSKVNETKDGYLIGYLRIKQFNANASRETKGVLIDYENKNISGYILDLRSNPGGLLDSSIDISRQFINKGIIVSTVSKNGLKEIKQANGSAITKKPLVVLVNEGSASASEIVSGAIRDNQRGKLVGKKTFGKGLVQSMRTLIDGSGLTVTVAKYLTPNGTDINKFGITPDIEVNMNMKILPRDIGTRKDKQYKVGEKVLLQIINNQNSYNSFNPKSTNLNSALKNKYLKDVYSLKLN
tara:strand:+ start:16911 stop:18233 length:1323 start_codon:yes stop_codon:yes gene_type:complete